MLNLQGWKTQQVRFRNNWKWVQMIPRHTQVNFGIHGRVYLFLDTSTYIPDFGLVRTAIA